jgi:predicted PurR-regulated permease PerM
MFRIVSLSVMLTLIVVLGITFFKVIAPFLMPLFLAGVVAILAQPLFHYFLRRTNGRVRLASGLTTGTVVSAILIPLTTAIAIASMQIYSFAIDVTQSQRWDDIFGTSATNEPGAGDSLLQWAADILNDFRGIFEPEPLLSDDPVLGTPTTSEADAAVAEEGSSTDETASEVTGANSAEGEASSTPDDTASPTTIGEVTPAESSDTDTTAETPAIPTTPEPVTDAAGTEPAATPDSSEPATAPDQTALVTARNISVKQPDAPLAETIAVLRSGREITPADLKQFAREQLGDFLTGLGDRSVGIVTGVFVSVISATISLLIFSVALYYFFADGTALLASTERLIPVHVDYQRELLDQFARVVRAVVSATFLAGLGQAVAVTVMLGLLGFNHLITLFALCLLSAMIPMLGTWLVWGPCVVILALADRWYGATFLAIYGLAVVGMLDNVIRTYVLNSGTKLHPLLALISVLGGLQVMGLWGVFFGPIVASCLHALVKIFNLELVQLSQSRFRGEGTAPEPSPASMAAEIARDLDETPNSPSMPVAPSVAAPPTPATQPSPATPKGKGKSGKRSRGR